MLLKISLLFWYHDHTWRSLVNSFNPGNPSQIRYTKLRLLLVGGNFTYTALGFLILAAGVLLLLFSPGVKKGTGSIVSFNEIGEVHISFRAIEKMVLAASQKVKE